MNHASDLGAGNQLEYMAEAQILQYWAWPHPFLGVIFYVHLEILIVFKAQFV